MKIRSNTIAFSLRQRFDEFCNFSEAILREFSDSVDEFLPFHERNYSTRESEQLVQFLARRCYAQTLRPPAGV